MSKRRKAGDIVWKRPGAGFVGTPGRVLLHPQHGVGIDICLLGCGDDACMEWANCEFLDDAGQPTGHYAYHVSECQMDDGPGPES